jgi:hypothetical protein
MCRGIPINGNKKVHNWYINIHKYLSVPDNARDAVFLHVSASSERQE